MKLLCWNIQHGGGSRVERIIEELAAHDADVMALTSYRTDRGKVLTAALRDRDWLHVQTNNPSETENGIAIFSRAPLRALKAAGVDPLRTLAVQVPEYGFGVVVWRVPAANGRKTPSGIAKARFWDAMLAEARRRLDRPFLFCGDWNTGAHRQDETGKTFVCAEQFAALSELGWIDLWRRDHPESSEWTWYSSFAGGTRRNGFRLDHAFATPSLASRVVHCRYSHVEREAGISGHSIVIVEVEPGASAPSTAAAED
jgi:exodeoxyribonuclease-3